MFKFLSHGRGNRGLRGGWGLKFTLRLSTCGGSEISPFKNGSMFGLRGIPDRREVQIEETRARCI